MVLVDEQREWIDRYRMIEDSRERLSIIVDEARGFSPLSEESRTDALRVPGCVSAVWLQGAMADGRCQFEVAADSVMVYGLVSLLTRLFSGHPPEEVIACPLEILEGLEFPRQISPTRMNGLLHVHGAIVDFARRHVGRTP